MRRTHTRIERGWLSAHAHRSSECPRSAPKSPSLNSRSSNPGSLFWSVHELLELCGSIPSISAVWWQASAPSVEDLRTLVKRLPPTVTYLVIDMADIEFSDYCLADWSVFAELTQLRRLCVSVDNCEKPVGEVVGEDDEEDGYPHTAGPGPRLVTYHLAKLMPQATVLVHTRTAEFDVEVDPRAPRPAHQDHCQPSLLLDSFLPGIESGWAADPCRRGPQDTGSRGCEEPRCSICGSAAPHWAPCYANSGECYYDSGGAIARLATQLLTE